MDGENNSIECETLLWNFKGGQSFLIFREKDIGISSLENVDCSNSIIYQKYQSVQVLVRRRDSN